VPDQEGHLEPLGTVPRRPAAQSRVSVRRVRNTTDRGYADADTCLLDFYLLASAVRTSLLPFTCSTLTP
jgi:hypothetical protein